MKGLLGMSTWQSALCLAEMSLLRHASPGERAVDGMNRKDAQDPTMSQCPVLGAVPGGPMITDSVHGAHLSCARSHRDFQAQQVGDMGVQGQGCLPGGRLAAEQSIQIRLKCLGPRRW